MESRGAGSQGICMPFVVLGVFDMSTLPNGTEGVGRVLSVPDIMTMYSQQMEEQPALSELLIELGMGPLCLCYSQGYWPTQDSRFVFEDVTFDPAFNQGHSSDQVLTFDDFAQLPAVPHLLGQLPEGIVIIPSRLLRR